MQLPSPARIPVTVIGGFLGAGKTTLVNHLLRTCAHHFGVIVNEFGNLGVDGALIQAARADESGLDLAELTAGCLCCSGQGDLLRALFDLATRPKPPAHVLIELSGVADPVPVLGTLLDQRLRAMYQLSSLVAVADAGQLRRTLQENREGARQLAYAGVVVLNKAGEVSEEVLSAAEDAVLGLNPLAKLIRAQRAEVSSEALLARQDFDITRLENFKPAPHTPNLGSFVLRAAAPLDPGRWHAFLREYVLSRPAEVLRVKGYLRLQGQNGRILFQAVRDVFSAERLNDENDGQVGTELVCIGRGLDQAEYQAALSACQVTLAAPPADAAAPA